MRPAEVDRAVAAAARAGDGADPLPHLEAGRDPRSRRGCGLGEQQEEFARTIAREAAKPITTARVEAARAVLTFEFAAAEARTLAGEMIPIDAASSRGTGKLGFTLRVPVGRRGGDISPFNFPLNLVAHKLAPAIAAGCAVVLKPASQTPFSAIALVDLLLDECGLPAGWVNVVTGSGGTVGNAVVDHPGIDMITFTGSPEVGWGIRGRAARKKVSLELGNNSPVIIDETGDWRTAATKIKVAGFSHAGQSCISTQQAPTCTARWPTGSPTCSSSTLVDIEVSEPRRHDPMDDATGTCPRLIDARRDRAGEGVDRRSGGRRAPRWPSAAQVEGTAARSRPCSPASTDHHAGLPTTEIFGPVVAVQAYDDFGDAVAGRRQRHPLRAAGLGLHQRPRARPSPTARTTSTSAGSLVNEVPTFRTDQMPYGGVRDSGNTKEGPHYAVREMTRERLVILQP